MSFWKESPGPTWWDCIESFNPCIQSPFGLCNPYIQEKQRKFTLPKGLSCIVLQARHADDMEKLLKEQFTIYPRCKISLSKERIAEGFLRDEWIGIGVYSVDKKMIGCCVSKALGSFKFPSMILENGGVVDYFCVHNNYRKQGIASFLLEELVFQTAKKKRFAHIFLKEGFPLWHLPPLYYSQYIYRKKEKPGQGKDYFGSAGIENHIPIQSYTHAEYLPLTKFAANLPKKLSGDSEIFGFNYKGHSIFLCMTDLHHRSVPEGHTIGELSWMLPQTVEVPLSLQRLAVETCIDCSKFDIVLMDTKIPHDTKRAWQKDATYSWYMFNYNPGSFFKVKPFWIF